MDKIARRVTENEIFPSYDVRSEWYAQHRKFSCLGMSLRNEKKLSINI